MKIESTRVLGISLSRPARLSGLSRFKICRFELGDGELKGGVGVGGEGGQGGEKGLGLTGLPRTQPALQLGARLPQQCVAVVAGGSVGGHGDGPSPLTDGRGRRAPAKQTDGL